MAHSSPAPDSQFTSDRLDALAEQLTATADLIRARPASVQGMGKERSRLMDAAEALLKELKQPDPIMDAMVTMVQFTAIRLFVEWKVFEAIPSDGPIACLDLATVIGADESLITRLAAVLVSTGVLRQVEDGRVSHTQASAVFASATPMNAIVRLAFDDHLKSLHSMPAYFAEYGLKEPAGRYHTVHAFAAGDPNQTVWEHTNRNPEKEANFMASMVAMSSRMTVAGSYDFSWILGRMSEAADRPLIVDVGGGKGHALQAICLATPGLPMNRCVVEDLKTVVDKAEATATGQLKGARFVATDFHKDQPVKGALVYFIRRCLHDYGDDDSAEILYHIRQAMADDSRLLIVEQILEQPPAPLAAACDIFMATLGGKERTIEGFKELASRAGLSIASIHPSQASDVSVIECQKK